MFHGGGVAESARNVAKSVSHCQAWLWFAPERDFLLYLERGEEVITAKDPRHRRNFFDHDYGSLANWVSRLPKFHEGGVAGGSGGSRRGAPYINISLVNESGTQLEAVDNGTEFDGESFVRSIILRDVRRNGSLTKALRLAVR